LNSFGAIDAPHEMLRQIYMKIFALLFGEDDRSTFQKLFGSKAKMKKQLKEEADELMQKLISLSGTLLEAITLLEQEITGMSEEELSNIY
jgi:hypothetical protein